MAAESAPCVLPLMSRSLSTSTQVATHSVPHPCTHPSQFQLSWRMSGREEADGGEFPARKKKKKVCTSGWLAGVVFVCMRAGGGVN